VTIFQIVMSKNNNIKHSDKKYIRTQKAKIRAEFSDAKKQKEMIDALYARFIKKTVVGEVKKDLTAQAGAPKKAEAKKVVAKKSKAK